MFVLLDTGTLGWLTNPNSTTRTRDIQRWMRLHLARGVRFRVPEIADYELRRNLILEKAAASLARLDVLKNTVGYLPLTTEIMNRAAGLWADVRRIGMMTAPKEALDGDAILAAQAITVSEGIEQVIIATDNLGHLNRFSTPTVCAETWQNI